MPEPTAAARRAVVRCPFCLTLNRVDLARIADGPRCADCKVPLHLDRPLPAGDDDLAEILRSTEVPVLVDFYADWCAPCKVMAPVLDEVAREHQGRALVLKVDTDRHQAASARYGIRGIPTLILFRSGAEAGRQVGAVPKDAVEAMLR